jgi:bacteriocin biosynthesis cyclodehydratase domain-containing protein
LVRWNRTFLDRGGSWLPITPFDGSSALIGPLMIPGETCCYECLIRRRASNVEFSERFRDVWLDAGAAPTVPALTQWMQAIAALVLTRWLVQASPDVTSRVYRLDPALLRVDSAFVFPVPRCSACSAAAWLPLPAPWEIE